MEAELRHQKTGVYYGSFSCGWITFWFHVFQMAAPFSKAVSTDQTMSLWPFPSAPSSKTCLWTSVWTCAQRRWGHVLVQIMCICADEYVCVSCMIWCLYFRRNHWLSWPEIGVTAASRLLSSPSTSWRTRTCVSIAATGRNLRAAGMTSTLWCTRRRFKVKIGG